MDVLDDFYTDHPGVDWCKTTEDIGHSQHCSKRISFSTWWLSFLRMPLQSSHKYFVQKAKRLWMATSEMTGCSFLAFTKNHKTNFVLKIPIANFVWGDDPTHVGPTNQKKFFSLKLSAFSKN